MKRRPKPHGARVRGLAIEPLEARVTPTTYTWTGLDLAAPTSWNDPRNWSSTTGGVPVDGSDLVFPASPGGTLTEDMPSLNPNSMEFDGDYSIEPGSGQSSINVGAGGMTVNTKNGLVLDTQSISFDKSGPVNLKKGKITIGLSTGIKTVTKIANGAALEVSSGNFTSVTSLNGGGDVIFDSTDDPTSEFITFYVDSASTVPDATNTFTGTISGPGSLIVDGFSTTQTTGVQAFALSDASNYSGAIEVRQGVLLDEGSLGGSSLEVFNNAGFGGFDESGITRAPISVNGDVSLDPGSSLLIHIDGAASSQFDRLDESAHTVTLGGSNLTIIPSTTVPAGKPFTIITADLIVNATQATGQFANAPEGKILTAQGISYKIHYTNTAVTLTQLPAPSTIRLITSPGSITYGNAATFTATVSPSIGSGPTPTGSIQFQVDGVNFGPSESLANGTVTSPSDPNLTAGNHTVTAIYSGDGNYATKTSVLSFSVAKAVLTVTADAKSKTYGDPDPILTYHITSGGLIGSDALSGSLTRVPGENVGTYPIQQGTLTAGNNYSLTFVGANLTISSETIGDFLGNGKTSVTVFRRTNSLTMQWFVRNYVPLAKDSFGASSLDVPVTGDFDGDGKADPAVYRPSTAQWFVQKSTNNYVGQLVATFGWANHDIPVHANYNGGTTTIGVYRPTTGEFFIQGKPGSTIVVVAKSGDVPVPGNYDNTGKDELAVFRPGAPASWFILGPSGVRMVSFGGATDVPVPGAYDATRSNPAVEPAVYRPSTGQWYILTPSGVRMLQFKPGDIPAPGDYDGIGATEAAVYRPGTGQFFVVGPNDTVPRLLATFGGPADIPPLAPYSYRALGISASALRSGNADGLDFGAVASGMSNGNGRTTSGLTAPLPPHASLADGSALRLRPKQAGTESRTIASMHATRGGRHLHTSILSRPHWHLGALRNRR
jgi:hypothetical protein